MSETKPEKLMPRRSALYMPCSNARALEKAATIPADVLIFDLEDAVAPDSKTLARKQIVAALANRNYGQRERVVRINPVAGAWGYDDLKALAAVPFDGLMLPKVESLEQVNEALAILGHEMPVWVNIETPMGVLQVEKIVSHKSVAVVVMGTNDLAKEMRVRQSPSRAEFAYAFGRCLMVARAFGCDILDGVYNQLDDESGFTSVCEQGKLLGFDGKTLIHPKQVEPANRIFMPGSAELDEARALVAAWETSGKGGVLVVNGRLVEELHVVAARRLVAMADRIANG